MTPIKDILADYYPADPSNPFQRWSGNLRLFRFFQNLTVAGPGWRFFSYMLRRRLGSANPHWTWDPDNVVGFCERLNLHYWEDLVAFLGAFDQFNVNVAEFEETILPTLTFEPGELREISTSELTDLIASKPELADAELEPMDSSYLVPPKSKIEYIMGKCPARLMAWKADTHDCDDYSIDTRSWLSQNNLGNLTLGWCLFRGYGVTNELMFAHSIVAFVYYDDDTGELGFCLAEPQSKNKIWDLGESEPGFKGLDRIEIYDLTF